MTRNAVFVDRDGTLMVDTHYINDPAKVQLIADAPGALQMARTAGLPIVVVTNQSGIGRGMITPAQYAAVRDRLTSLLAAHGAAVDATYHCPHFVERDGPCDCRKPELGMYHAAARDHGLSLHGSAFMGDRWRDVAPALEVGGFGVLVPRPASPSAEIDRARAEANVAPTLTDAMQLYLAWRQERSTSSAGAPTAASSA